jgi:IS1 family transposase/transposase-like protein
MKCQYCKQVCVKIGKQKDGTQKYRCKECKKYQQEIYRYNACIVANRKLIPLMVVNNCGFAGVARVLNVAKNTVSKYVLREGDKCKPPAMPAKGIYEVDEMRAYHKKGKKDIWAVYAIERKTGKKIGINVGKRNTTTIRKTINTVLMTDPRRIITDGYSVYKSLVPVFLHKVAKKMLVKVERLHLTARNGIKMLNRKTLAFVRKPETLLAVLKLLFWGGFD